MNAPLSTRALPSPSAPVWDQLTRDRQRQAIGLMAQLAVKLIVTRAQPTLPEVHHDTANAR
jgi:hypothetical protein